MDLDAYLTTNVLVTFTDTLGIRYHYVDITVVALVVGGVAVAVPATCVVCLPNYVTATICY